MIAESESIDRATLLACGDVADADGVPFAVYAAERLFDGGRAHRPRSPTMSPRPPAAGRSGRHRTRRLRFSRCCAGCRPAVAAEPLRKLTLAIHDVEQVVALAANMQARIRNAVERASPERLPATSRGWGMETSRGL